MTTQSYLALNTKPTTSSVLPTKPSVTTNSSNTGNINLFNNGNMGFNGSSIINLINQLLALFNQGSNGLGGLLGGALGAGGMLGTNNGGGLLGGSSWGLNNSGLVGGGSWGLNNGGSTISNPLIQQNIPSISLPVIGVNSGSTIWGDPHFVGADGEKYDIKGEAGKTYNILSDKNLQLNAAFRAKESDQTLMGSIGATIKNEQGTHNIKFTEKGELSINNKVLKDGTYQLGSSSVKKQGTDLTIKTPEYEITSGLKSGELALNFKSSNVAADGIMPHGFWGQTADGDGKKRDGEEGSKAQGGGVLQKLDGSIAAKGDTSTYKFYEVKDLFDTNFANFNRFNGTSGFVDKAKVSATGSAD